MSESASRLAGDRVELGCYASRAVWVRDGTSKGLRGAGLAGWSSCAIWLRLSAAGLMRCDEMRARVGDGLTGRGSWGRLFLGFLRWIRVLAMGLRVGRMIDGGEDG